MNFLGKVMLSCRSNYVLNRCSQVRLLTTTSQGDLDISGVYPPIATPFEKDGSVAYEKLKVNFDVWNKTPLKGYVVMGSNGEAVSLRYEEKVKLVKNVRALANPDHVIIAGTGCHSTAETIDLTRQVAEEQSADAVLVITPSFYRGRMTDSALQTHYEAVADASPLPVILYSVPMNTNLDLSADVILKLAQHENIIGLKDSSGDIGKISRIVYATKDQKFQVLVGSAGVLLPALLMGSVGGICGLANILANEVCQVYDLYRNNQLEAAISLQQRLVLPNLMVTRKFGVSGLKKVMDIVGLYGGPTRPPLLPVEPAEVEQLKQVFQQENFMRVRS